MVRVLLLVALSSACGRIGYDPGATLLDAAEVDASVPDATILGSFGPATLISELSDVAAGDDDPTLTADRLEIYLNSNRAGGIGGGDIWVSTRLSTMDSWSAPTLVAELSSVNQETAPEVSADGLALWFASDRPGGQGGSDVWVSTRATRTMPWSAPTVVPELSSASSDTSPTPGWSQLFLILESNRAGGAGDADLFLATRPNTASLWSTPAPVTEINTSFHEGSAHFGPNRLTVVFNSSRDGNADLYIATRENVDLPFETPVPLAEINSPDNEQDPWISDDLRHIVFVSTRSGGTEIYEASR